MNLGPLEIGGILLLFVLLFGAKKLPDLGASVGKSIKNFKKGINDPDEEAAAADAEVPPVATTVDTPVATTVDADVPPATQTARRDS